MRTAVFPGSFDPMTLGHLDIITRAARLFDRLVVAVALNPDKQPLFSIEERVRLLEESLAGLPNVDVTSYEGLTAVFVSQTGAGFLVRSIRDAADFSAELQMLNANRQIEPGLETVLLAAHPEFSHIASSLVRQVAALGYKNNFDDTVLDKWVSPGVKAALKRKHGSKPEDGFFGH